MGRERYPNTDHLTITADGGGSNGARVRLWKVELQKLADETGLDASGLPLSAGHVEVEQDRAPAVLPHHPELARPAADQPPGRGRTDRRHHDQDRSEGRCELDTRTYPKGIKVSEPRWPASTSPATLSIPEWNYTIAPRAPLDAVIVGRRLSSTLSNHAA